MRYVIDTDREWLIDTADGSMVQSGPNLPDLEAYAAKLNAWEDVAEANPHPAYGALIARAAEHGWPALWKTDLTRADRYYLATERPRRFAWVLRENGTFLLPATPSTEAWAKMDDWARAIAKTWPDSLWFTVDGTAMAPVTAERARAWLAECDHAAA